MCNRYQPGDRHLVTDHFKARLVLNYNAGPDTVHPKEPGWVVRSQDGERVLEHSRLIDSADADEELHRIPIPLYQSVRAGEPAGVVEFSPLSFPRYWKSTGKLKPMFLDRRAFQPMLAGQAKEDFWANAKGSQDFSDQPIGAIRVIGGASR